MNLRLVTGNKNYSSWSLRPWLVLKVAGIPFEEINVSLYKEDTRTTLLGYSPAAKVPVLLVDETPCWDSLAICETLHELFPDRRLWPADKWSRISARAISNEMHSGFGLLRHTLPMNCRARGEYRDISPDLQGEIDRIREIWVDCRQKHGAGGDFLFGEFSIADAMYAPVVLRFNSYGIDAGDIERNYMDTIMGLPQLQEWINAALQETERLKAYEVLA